MNVRERLIVAGFLVLGGTNSLMARSAGAPQGVTGAPGDGICTNCHRTNALNSGPGKLTVTFSDGTSYTPGKQQKVTVKIEDPDKRWGFEASPRVASDTTKGAGEISPSDGNTHLAAPAARCNG